jgi:AcrR family transcriptional regulator
MLPPYWNDRERAVPEADSLFHEMSLSRSETHDSQRSLREERRERELELRRADVLAAATAEFAEKGFAGAQMSALAARAELALGTLYSLFASKEQLFQAVVETGADALRSTLEAEVLAVSDPRERLLRLIDAGFERFQRDPALFRIFAQSTHGLPARIRDAMGESAQARFADSLRFAVRLAREAAAAGVLRGIDPEAFGLALMGALVNVTTAIIEGTAERPAEALAADVRALFECLLEPPPGATR